MQGRIKMFVEEEKIEYVYYLISGYCIANHNFPSDDLDKRFTFWFDKWLIMWIKDNIDSKYAMKTVYWYEDIKMLAEKNGQDEVALFFDLCKSFFSDYENKVGYFSWRNE